MLTRLALIAVGVLIAAQRPAYAYTDPGSGALILQLILAASFGVMFYLRRIISWFRGLRSHKETVTSAKALSRPSETEKGSESIKVQVS